MTRQILSTKKIKVVPSAHPIAIMRPLGCHASTVTSLSWLRDEFGMRAPYGDA